MDNISKVLKYRFILIISILFIHWSSPAQSHAEILDTKFSFELHDASFSELMMIVEDESRFIFSYKSEVLQHIPAITCHISNENIQQILNYALKDTRVNYTVYQHHIVLHVEDKTLHLEQIDTVWITKEIPVLRTDTVYVHKSDTVMTYLTDTIYKERILYQTKTDTIYQDSALLKRGNPLDATSEISSKNKNRFTPFYSLSLSMMSPSYETQLLETNYLESYAMLSSAENPALSYRTNIEIGLQNKHLRVSSGAGISTYRQQVDYNYTSVMPDSSHIIDYEITEHVSIFKIDSIYIVVPGRDTSWYYEFDTLKTYDVDIRYKKDTVDYQYKGINSLTYFTLPIKLAYAFNISENSRINIEAGMLIDFLLSTKGYALSKSPYKELVPLSSLPISPICATTRLGLGYEYQLSSKHAIFATLHYSFMLNSMYSKSFPIQRKVRTFEFSIGYRWH